MNILSMLLYISRNPFLICIFNSTSNQHDQELQISSTYSDLFYQTGMTRVSHDWTHRLGEQGSQSFKRQPRVRASFPDLLDIADTHIQLPTSQMFRNLLASQDLCTPLS